MIKLYLVTGFLGAGKTTFLKKFIYLFENQKLALIVNEFGKEGIDGALLSPLGIALSEINNGSIFCSCRLDQFEQVLDNTIAQQPDVIVVEASGLSDPTNVRKILAQPGWAAQIQYMGSICLVDANSFEKVYSTARVCKKQLAASDVVILNKTDLAAPQKVDSVKQMILSQRPDLKIYETTFGTIQSDWIQSMVSPELLPEEYAMQTKDVTLKSHQIVLRNGFPRYNLVKFLEMFLEDTYRVKGFVRFEDGIYLVDCVGNLVKVEKYGETVKDSLLQKIVVLSGGGMSTGKSISEAVKWYSKWIDSWE
jgi:G3E family GTPase